MSSDDDYSESQISIDIGEASPDHEHHGEEQQEVNVHRADDLHYQYYSMLVTLKKLVLEALKDGTIILLMCCASLSLLIDVRRYGPNTLFLDGLIIFLALFFVSTFGNIFRFLKTIWMLTRSKKKRSTAARGKHHTEASKFEEGIHKTSSRLEKIWLSLYLFILIVQVIKCFLCKCDDEDNNLDPKGVKNTVEEIMNEATKIAYKKGENNTNGLVRVLCVVIFATRDGLPLGLFVLFFIASKKMKLFEDDMIRKLSACATLGMVTTLFVSNTGDLTLNHAKIGELWVGLNLISDVSKEVKSCQVLKKLQVGVCMNSSGSRAEQDSLLVFWAQKVLQVDNHDDDIEKNYIIIHNESVEVQRDGNLLVQTRTGDTNEALEMHWKGDLESVLSNCSHYHDPDGTIQTLDEEKRAKFNSIIVEDDTRSHLQCFAFAYKKLVQEEESASTKLDKEEEEDEAEDPEEESEAHGRVDVADENTPVIKLKADDHDHGWILIGLIVLKNPYPPEVKEAIQACNDLGVSIKLMVHDDDERTARIIALSSGILNPNQLISESAVIKGSQFRSFPEEIRMKVINDVHVIVNATPADKLLIVQCLKKKGKEVAMSGSCIDDLSSLTEAEAEAGNVMNNDENDIPELAKEDADTIIINPKMNMGEMVDMIRFGRYVCQSIANFLELHVILNFCAVTMNLIFEVWKSQAVFSSLQLVWTNLVVETLGAFALGMMMLEMKSSTHQHHQEEENDGVFLPVITKKMWRNVAIHTGSQVAFLLVLGLKGKGIHVDDGVLKSMIFNSFILCQVFVLIGIAMKMKGKLRLPWRVPPSFSMEKLFFLIVIGVILALQVVMTDIMAVVGHWGNMDFRRWLMCMGIGGLSALVGCVANWITSSVALAFI